MYHCTSKINPMKNYALILLLAAATVISSCSKDDDDNTGGGGGGGTTVTNTSKLCNKNWKLVSFKLNGIDVTSQFFQPCDLDDFSRFLVDSTYTADEGPTKCDPADPQTSTGTWGWAASETKLIIDGDTSNVITNSGTSLKLGVTDPTLGTIELTFGL
jgi:hypothetical protein